jgi:hypothetical protein
MSYHALANIVDPEFWFSRNFGEDGCKLYNGGHL